MLIFDLETNGLFPDVSQIFCAVTYNTQTKATHEFIIDKVFDAMVQNVGSPAENVHPLRELPAHLSAHPYISCHNIIGYDKKVLKKVLNYNHPGEYIDTLLLSRILFPDIESEDYIDEAGREKKEKMRHSVNAWAIRFGLHKPEHSQWDRYSPEMLHRCEEDVKIQTKIYEYCINHMKELLENDPRIADKFKNVIDMEQKVAEFVEAQAEHGWQFDLQKAYEVSDRLSQICTQTEDRLVPLLPPQVKQLTKTETGATKAFVSGGSYSSHALKWFWNTSERPSGDFCKVQFKPFNIRSSQQVKDYLLKHGWEPTEYNYKKDKYNKPIRDANGNYIQTSPKSPKTAEEWAQIAEDLGKSEIALLAEYNKASHRLSQVRGLITAVRSDHRIESQANTCSTNCVVAGTLIQTDTGLIPIESVQKGDLILTHIGRYKPCEEFIVNGIKPVFRVTLANGMEVICTENHPFWTGDRFINAKDLQIRQPIKVIAGDKEWRKYPHGEYYVSNYGDIINSKIGYALNKTDLVRKRRLPLYQRGFVDIIIHGKKVKKRVGNIVAETFIGLRPEGMECCHIDGNPTNNYITNLKWGSSKEKSHDQKLHGRHITAIRQSKYCKLSQEDVDYIRAEYEKDPKRKGLYQKLGNELGCSRKNIAAICAGKRWKRRSGPESYEFRYMFMDSLVTSVEYIGEHPTFDITVQEDHSYVGNGVVLHNTARMTHRVVVNIPKASDDVYFGKEMRSLFTASPGKILVGCDASALEARCEAHYIYPYSKEQAERLIHGDIHTINADVFKCSRNTAKTLKYAILYGAGPAKVAAILKCSMGEAKNKLAAYWEENSACKQLIEDLNEEYNQYGYILAIDGRPLSIRFKHAILNTLLQSCGAIAMKKAIILFHNHTKRLGYEMNMLTVQHDEIQSECVDAPIVLDDDGKIKHLRYGDMIGRICVNSIRQAGRDLNLNITLEAEYHVGRSWSETH